jgi:hypothetical protein
MKKNRAKSYGRNATIETLQLLSRKLLAITQTQDVGDDLSASSSRGPVAMSADPADVVRCEDTCGGH